MKDNSFSEEMLRNLFRVVLAGLLMIAGVGLLFYVNHSIENSTGKPATIKPGGKMLAQSPSELANKKLYLPG